MQGVFFRDSTRQAARAAGVAGYATNRDDGTVEVVAEGAPDGVDELVAFCRVGPDRAAVDSVDVIDEEPEGLEDFRIR